MDCCSTRTLCLKHIRLSQSKFYEECKAGCSENYASRCCTRISLEQQSMHYTPVFQGSHRSFVGLLALLRFTFYSSISWRQCWAEYGLLLFWWSSLSVQKPQEFSQSVLPPAQWHFSATSRLAARASFVWRATQRQSTSLTVLLSNTKAKKLSLRIDFKIVGL